MIKTLAFIIILFNIYLANIFELTKYTFMDLPNIQTDTILCKTNLRLYDVDLTFKTDSTITLLGKRTEREYFSSDLFFCDSLTIRAKKIIICSLHFEGKMYLSADTIILINSRFNFPHESKTQKSNNFIIINTSFDSYVLSDSCSYYMPFDKWINGIPTMFSFKGNGGEIEFQYNTFIQFADYESNFVLFKNEPDYWIKRFSFHHNGVYTKFLNEGVGNSKQYKNILELKQADPIKYDWLFYNNVIIGASLKNDFNGYFVNNIMVSNPEVSYVHRTCEILNNSSSINIYNNIFKDVIVSGQYINQYKNNYMNQEFFFDWAIPKKTLDWFHLICPQLEELEYGEGKTFASYIGIFPTFGSSCCQVTNFNLSYIDETCIKIKWDSIADSYYFYYWTKEDSINNSFIFKYLDKSEITICSLEEFKLYSFYIAGKKKLSDSTLYSWGHPSRTFYFIYNPNDPTIIKDKNFYSLNNDYFYFYPNPTNGTLFFRNITKNYFLYDVNGKRLYYGKNEFLDLRQYGSGIYFLEHEKKKYKITIIK